MVPRLPGVFRYHPRVRPDVRIALITLGLAAALYGTASLTGGWMGTPPWWDRAQRWSDLKLHQDVEGVGFPHDGEMYPDPPRGAVGREGREWISGGVVAAGLAVAAFGAWPRRRRAVTAP